MRFLLYCFFYFFYTHSIIATEYVYPVAALNDGITILYIHQLSPDNIQLFSWNTITNHIEQLLWSLFNPANLQLLPNNKGFSFIDNGRLRIKAFHKRAPKAIDFDEPIFNINSLHWIDEHICYCSAQQGDNFALFELNENGTIKSLINKNESDCMYPQKVDHLLFYIERNKTNTDYRIMQTQYSAQNNAQLQTIAHFNDKPIIFLHMISREEGFVIEHEKNIPANNKSALFSYHRLIKKEEGNWEIQLLFSFEIPTYLFLYDNEQRLFESILPLLPRIIEGKIYFSASKNNSNLELYSYELATMQIGQVPLKMQGHSFVPVLCNTKFCYGGTKSEKELPLSVF
jgi:hypothetical protein